MKPSPTKSSIIADDSKQTDKTKTTGAAPTNQTAPPKEEEKLADATFITTDMDNTMFNETAVDLEREPATPD